MVSLLPEYTYSVAMCFERACFSCYGGLYSCSVRSNIHFLLLIRRVFHHSNQKRNKYKYIAQILMSQWVKIHYFSSWNLIPSYNRKATPWLLQRSRGDLQVIQSSQVCVPGPGSVLYKELYGYKQMFAFQFGDTHLFSYNLEIFLIASLSC